MKRTFRLGFGAIGAALAVVVPVTPAHASVNACGQFGSSIGLAYSSTHQADVYACAWDDNSTIYSTAEIYNYGTDAWYTITAQLRRASDNLLIASAACTVYVYSGTTSNCTKAWPWSSAVVRTTAVATRSPLTSQAIVSSPNYTT